MQTVTAPMIFRFKEINKGKYRSVRHYENLSSSDEKWQQLNISRDRQFSNSQAKFWLKIREGNKWGKYMTGLFPTTDTRIFYGDTQNKGNMLWFVFSEDRESLKLFIFPNFYTRDIINFLKGFKNKYQ